MKMTSVSLSLTTSLKNLPSGEELSACRKMAGPSGPCPKRVDLRRSSEPDLVAGKQVGSSGPSLPGVDPGSPSLAGRFELAPGLACPSPRQG